MSKKSAFIIIFIFLAVIGIAAWYLFFRTSPEAQNGTQNNPTDLFPFGQGAATSTAPNPGNQQGQGGNTIDLGGSSNGTLPQLRKLWDDQTAGAGFLSSGSTTVAVRFVDRATGHIYEAPVEAEGESKISNITIPQIYEALFAANGKELLLRYLKDDSIIQTFYARLSSATTTASTTLEGYFLPQGITDVAVSGDRMLYRDPAAGGTNLIRANIDGSQRASVFNSALSEWLLSWNSPDVALLSSKPSGEAEGFIYALNMAKGTFLKAIGGISGLTGNVNPTGKYAFLSAQQGSGIASAILSVASSTTVKLPVGTLSDKCAWANKTPNIVYCAVPTNAPKATYPDAWYQGTVSFSDTVWKIDASTGLADIVFDPSFESGEEMDMFKLALDPSDSYLVFTNKKDMTLWLYRLAY